MNCEDSGRASRLIAVDLTQGERDLLARGLAEWGGPASAPEELARVIGFESSEDLRQREGPKLRDALRRGDRLTSEDWRRALLAAEIVFASDVIGAGTDWPITTGFSDEETIKILRIVQRKIRQADAT